jgi:protocatechuate 3,4-dioxygenase beta subunit
LNWDNLKLETKVLLGGCLAAFILVALVGTIVYWRQASHGHRSSRVAKTFADKDPRKPVTFLVRVVDGEGNPIRHASVTLQTGSTPIRQSTNSKGIARFSRVLSGEGKLLVEATGMARKTVPTIIRDTKNRYEVSLEKGESLQGSVTDDRGTAVVNAKVTLQLQDEEEGDPWTILSDNDGHFTATGLSAGLYTLDTEAELYDRSIRRQVRVPSNKPVTVIIQRTATLSGQVFDIDGNPAKGARLLIAGSGIWPPREVQTLEQGQFQIIGLPSGVYEVRASLNNAVSPPKQGIDLSPGSTTSTTLRLIPGVSLKGRVFDAVTNKPVSNAEVTVGEDSICFNPIATRTDINGKFTVLGLLNKPHRVSIRSVGYIPIIGQKRMAGSDEHPFPMRQAAVVAGQVVDNQGKPIAQALIELSGTSETGEPITMRSDALAFQSSLFESQLKGPLPMGGSVNSQFSNNLGTTTGPVPMIPSELNLPKSNSEKKTAEDVTSGYATDKDGRFRIQNVPPGTIQAIVRRNDYALGISKPFVALSGSTTNSLRIVLSEGGTVEGHVVDENGAAVALVRVELKAESEPLPRTVVTTEDGLFRFANVLGESVITASPIGQPTAQTKVLVEPKQVQQVELKVLTGSQTLYGRVVDGRGFPVAGAIVRVQSVTAPLPYDITALSESDGSFSVSGLPEPPYRISATHHDYSESPPSTVSSLIQDLVIQMETGVAITGTVIDEWNQKPLRGATVTLVRIGSSKREKTKTTNEGKFQFRNVTIDRYYISVEKQKYVSSTREVDLDHERQYSSAFELDPFFLSPGGSVSGEVVDNRGVAVGNAEVAIGEPPGWKDAVKTDNKGRFQITGVPPGSIVVSARHKTAGHSETPRLTRVYPLQETPGLLIRLPNRITNDTN